MLLDAGKDQDRKIVSETRYDICIIGSGAAGLAMAHSLIDWAEKNSKKVIVLEASRRNDKGNSIVSSNHRYEDHDIQPIYDGVMVESDGITDIAKEGKTSREFFLASRIKAYGGTTNCWQGWTRPLDDVDFDSPADPTTKWPAAVKKDLKETYYDKAMFYCSLDSWRYLSAYRASYWPIEATHYNKQLAEIKGADKYQLQSDVVLQIGGERNKQPPDNDGAWSFQLRWGPAVEKARNVTICRNANVRSLLIASGTTYWANATTVKDGPQKGDDFKVSGTRYVLAASCVENVRLLLRSGFTTKELPTLGSHLMTHPLIEAAAQFRAPESSKLTAAVRDYYAGAGIDATQFPPSVMAMLTPTLKLITDKKIGNFRAWLRFGDKNTSWWGALNLCWEQKPSADNTITLDLQANDKLFGDPLPRVKIALGETDWTTLKVARDAVRAFLTDKNGNPPDPYADQYGDVGSWPKLTGEHAMGGTRFGDNATRSVVDNDCKVHTVPNLYVAGGSLFPTGGWANPTLTIIALALRLAKHLETK